jgi:hypothetical protein
MICGVFISIVNKTKSDILYINVDIHESVFQFIKKDLYVTYDSCLLQMVEISKKIQTWSLFRNRQIWKFEDILKSFRHLIYNPCKNRKTRRCLSTSTYTSTFSTILQDCDQPDIYLNIYINKCATTDN